MFCNHCGAANAEGSRFCSGCGGAITSSMPGKKPTPVNAETETGLPIGHVLANRYLILAVLGMGGMGRVYLAEDRTLNRRVAIKVLREVLSRDPGAVKRLIAEANHSMTLAHPNVVRVHNFEDGELVKFLIMEYVEGETLAKRLAEQGKLTESEARRIAIGVCQGLEHAHEHKVIHRDIKPGNILLGKSGAVKLADFGIARECRDSASRLTSQVHSGTLLYMSPEQQAGKSSELSDVYSLGVVLYEMLSGEPPFRSGDIAWQIREVVPEPLARVSPELNAIVLQCLEKKPERRFDSARALRKELDEDAAARRNRELEAVGTAERAEAPRRKQDEKEENKHKRLADIKWEFVKIPAGDFIMGASPEDAEAKDHEKPAHQVRITCGFELGRYLVTQAMWESVMGDNPSEFKGNLRPVEQVCWVDIQEFLKKVNDRRDGYCYRLPTEAEWEYAARAGTTGPRYGDLHSIAWSKGNSGNETHPVGEKQPNRFGLYDMLGNVWEWCQDWYYEKYYEKSPATDPTGPTAGEFRVLRGGAYFNDARFIRVSVRLEVEPIPFEYGNGFRVCREPL